MVAGFRGTSRRDLIDSIPIDLLCDFIYGLIVKDMDEKERDEFDADLFATIQTHDEAKEERKRIARELLGG